MSEPETTVLIIDDDKNVHAKVESHLADVVDEIHATDDPIRGIQMATQHRPDLILLDINMPMMDGLKVCRHLREGAITRDIPIIFLTVDRNFRNLARALDCGGSDYIDKPFSEVELCARVRAALRTKRLIDLLKEQAHIDPLTGLKNRAALDDALKGAVSAHERTGQPVSLLMIDVDRFKAINDDHGHGVGDEVLRLIGRTIRAGCRPYDTACRFGGDEFAIILGLTEGLDAEHVSRRLYAKLTDSGTPCTQRQFAFTISAGLVSSASIEGSFEATDLLKSADAALYEAKRRGRSLLVVG
jgi:two-component system cell cycle response regulator